MKRSLSTISTLNASFAEDVETYAAAGFDAIGLWEMKLPDDDDANLALIRSHGLAVSNCIPTVPSFLQLAIPGMEGPVDPVERADAICASVRRLARYGPDCVLCLSGPLGGRTVEEGRATVVDGLRRAADAAREAGVRLAFEPIHPSQNDTAGFICSLADALAVLDEAGAAEVGILADTYNLAGEEPAALAEVIDRIVGVHVADELPEPVPGVRALPEADGRSAALVEALREAGWEGTLDVEIFSTPDGFWARPPDEAARAALDAVSQLWR
ncbi:MAG TPA: sugar phosphate isomerase/epimerase family protein [Gaiella sp.]